MLNTRQRMEGASLIEVLVSVLIFSTALLALAALHTRSLQFNHSAYARSQVNILAAELFDRMRINQDGISAYQMSLGPVIAEASSAASDSGSSSSAPAITGAAAVAAQDIGEWRAKVGAIVPDAKAKIECEASRICEVEIIWDYQIGTGELAESDKTNRLVFNSRI